MKNDEMSPSKSIKTAWFLNELFLSLMAIFVFSVGYWLHVKYDLRYEFITHSMSGVLGTAVALFFYLGAWMAMCITIIVSRFMSVKRFWFWQLFIIFSMSLSSSLILTKHSFGVLSVSRVADWQVSYAIMLAATIIPVLFIIYIFKKKKGAKL